MLKKDLERKLNAQFNTIENQYREINLLKREIELMKRLDRYTNALTTALTTTTDAVAHVLTDLKRR